MIVYRQVINGHDVRARSDYVTVVRQRTGAAVQQVIWMEADNGGLKDTNRILLAACEAEHVFGVFGFNIDIGRPEGPKVRRTESAIFFLDRRERPCSRQGPVF